MKFGKLVSVACLGILFLQASAAAKGAPSHGLGALNMNMESGVPRNTARSPERSTTRAFLLSALVPGSGQLYAGTKRGFLFLAVEALTWTGYLTWTHKGKELEDDYERFADLHWSEDRYNDYIWTAVIGTPDTTRLTHNYETSSRQQQYEMIGKYDQFVYGWDDTDASADGYPPVDSLKNVQSTHRLKYEDMRYESNRYLRRALFTLGVILCNHLFSAIDAARYAKSQEEGKALEERLKVRMALRFEAEATTPMLVVSRRF
ncbi:MAG TPA: hypothetical protein EYP53_08990 [Candidatus Latescibacteria bacterium]|nr:hypothetical protein [Candidatus Latescibacterota bacterium]